MTLSTLDDKMGGDPRHEEAAVTGGGGLEAGAVCWTRQRVGQSGAHGSVTETESGVAPRAPVPVGCRMVAGM